MDLGKEGLTLSKDEATDLYLVLFSTKRLTLPKVARRVLAEANITAQQDAAEAAEELEPALQMIDQENFVIRADRFPSVLRASELALNHTQAIMDDLCLPSIPDGYRHDWRANALGALQTTAIVSDRLRAVVPVEQA